jgi:DNA-binding CsgD family transcriptional regulator
VTRTFSQRRAAGHMVESLSDRELEIFKMIGEGQTTNDMADLLHLSSHTIDTYRRRIRIKLRIRTGAELMHTATEWVLLEQKNQR